MARTKKEKVLTDEQKETIINLFVNQLRSGNRFQLVRKQHLVLDVDKQQYEIVTTMFRDNKQIIMLYVRNKTTRSEVMVECHLIKNMDKEFAILQKHVDSVIDNTNIIIEYDDKEFNDIIGLDGLIEQRRKKVGHLVDNIEDKQKRKRFKFR